jgi:hypothetical protein
MRNLTPRGWFVLVILPAIVLIAGLVWMSASLWYVPGEGYCIGSMLECFH